MKNVFLKIQLYLGVLTYVFIALVVGAAALALALLTCILNFLHVRKERKHPKPAEHPYYVEVP